jgi:hypothetical protein
MKSLNKVCILAAIAVTSIAQNAQSAVLLPITNPSFENPVLAPGAFVAGNIGWTSASVTQNIFAQGSVADSFNLPSGPNVAALSYNESISQTLSSSLAEGDYVLSAYFAQNIFAPTSFPFQLQLFAGTTLLTEFSIIPTTTLTQYSTLYTALGSDDDLGQSLKIVINASFGTDFAAFQQTFVDGVSLSYTAVPEPGTATMLFVAGLLSVCFIRFQQIRRQRIASNQVETK